MASGWLRAGPRSWSGPGRSACWPLLWGAPGRRLTRGRAAIAGLLAAPAAGEQGPITVTSDPGLRFRVVGAFTDLVEELALAGPLVIGLDDLQWADPSSLLTLGVLGRRLDYVPVGLITCFRPSHQTAELDRLAGALEVAGARHLVLRP